ncbi:BCL-6 corepressor-like protein 1 [Drosophila montana]|uniref:BCL-6 corepressor-like protein 1 n=1 Tax=Drosophila montana TaxID=40370 RepID=UPI00313F078B
MSRTHLAKMLLIAALLIVGGQARPGRGRKRAFGVGLLGGALAGAVIGNAVAKAPGSAQAAAPASAPAPSPVAQVVETGVPDANGCYRQTIKEPLPGNNKLYTETVHLVCPHNAPPANPQPAMVVVPVAQAPAAAHPVLVAPAAPAATPATPAVVYNQTSALNSTHLNATHVLATGPAPAAVPASVPVAAAAPAPHSSLTVVYAAPPQQQHPQPAQPGTAHVILLSKTVKKQKSAACSINISQGLLILVVLYCLISK